MIIATVEKWWRSHPSSRTNVLFFMYTVCKCRKRWLVHFYFFPSRDSCNGLWEGDKELINAWTCIIGNKNNYQRWLYRDLRSDCSRVVSLSIYSLREGLLQDYFNLWRLCTRPRAKCRLFTWTHTPLFLSWFTETYLSSRASALVETIFLFRHRSKVRMANVD